ncbi:MAG: sensor histidine kinase [Phenylobacterium zucineum]|nr:MAG: sensor histidine kinase [Phenylobacterium zucineum]
MNPGPASGAVRTLILAPFGRDAAVAHALLQELGIEAEVCPDMRALTRACAEGAGLALIVEDVLSNEDYGPLSRWIDAQAPWSDFPIIILARRGAGLERNPGAMRFTQALGNVSFLERPFHPTTLVSMVQTALRGRRRQYEARDRLEALRSAVMRQQQDQRHLRLMVNELNHRVKNTLATVQSIVAQTMRGAEMSLRARETLTSRILALSKAHDVLTDEQWSGADLGEIASRAAQPFLAGLGEGRIRVSGPSVRVPPKTAIAIALALHELATNAVKYGALSVPEGHVEFSWELSRTGRRRDLHATWREIDGPHVSPPTRAGFGTRLIQRGLAADLNGQVEITYPASGVVCTIDACLEATDEEAETAAAARRRTAQPSMSLAPQLDAPPAA